MQSLYKTPYLICFKQWDMVFENIIYFTRYSNKTENKFASKKSILNVPNLNISQYVH